MRAGGSFLKFLKTWSALPVRLSPRDLVMGGISWVGLFKTPENLIRLARQVFSLLAFLGVGSHVLAPSIQGPYILTSLSCWPLAADLLTGPGHALALFPPLWPFADLSHTGSGTCSSSGWVNTFLVAGPPPSGCILLTLSRAPREGSSLKRMPINMERVIKSMIAGSQHTRSHPWQGHISREIRA